MHAFSKNILSDATPEEKEALYQRSLRVHDNMEDSYALARTRADPSMPVAKPNAKGVHPPKGMVLTINLKKVTNRHDRSLKVTYHSAQMMQYEHRILSTNDFNMCYAATEVKLNDEDTQSTLGYLWAQTLKFGKIHVNDKNQASRVLELAALVDYPPPSSKLVRRRGVHENAEYEDTSWGGSKKGKRKAQAPPSMSHDDRMPPPKRPVRYVECTDCHLDGTGGVSWVRSPNKLNVFIEKTKLASGKTKNAFKLRLDDTTYVAKTFYNISGDASDKSPISPSVNLIHLKDELLRMTLAKKCVGKFNEEAKANSVTIFDVRVADSFILTVASGKAQGQSWIVDRLLDSSKMAKYSGTQKAGANTGNLVGCTCDALAHFSLYDSQNTFLLVDIQGIIDAAIRDGRRRMNKELTLFDLMAHSWDKSKGLGDAGKNGIKEFMHQHICNEICVGLGLPELNEEDIPGDDDFDDWEEEYLHQANKLNEEDKRTHDKEDGDVQHQSNKEKQDSDEKEEESQETNSSPETPLKGRNSPSLPGVRDSGSPTS
ncbi:hypothetical protein NLJ89_g6881 [Agrocybe chaxingu]|uniref:Alpha-type protein kinase domain-containing protein n=1 Tax=Agrocybe chaxingu TaxID=84603 RepID=A0A9W8JXF3_9AGAR|nr:hypothetical protein NLJ89_g6881 [Agrocybe chaxingu]